MDATADFAQTLNDPTRWVIKPGVPVFKPHQRVDPATGQTIAVDVAKLYRIAANMQRLERVGGVPVRMTLGHTEPGKPETEQPPVGGYYRNARVAMFGPGQEPAIVVDEWLDPQYAPLRKNYPYRSAEYYDDTEQITGVALLTRDPYLDLGVVAYSKSLPGPVRYSADGKARPSHLFLMGVDPVYPTPQQPAVPGAPQTPPTAPQTATMYGGYPNAAHPYWNGQNNGSGGTSRANIGHNHQSGGAVYGAGYATDPPGLAGPPGMPGMGGPPPGPMGTAPGMIGAPGAPEDQLNMMYAQLNHLVENFSRYVSGRTPTANATPAPAPQPPAGPFPGVGMGTGTADAPYARPAAGPRPYANPTAPQTATTISGLPVGYQMKLDQLQYQLNQLQQTNQILMYERDQADTEACAAEIGRLAAAGYSVGDYEVSELKKKSRAERPAYIQHIVTKYERGAIDGLTPPPLMGDPTPAGPDPNANRPLSQDEMEAAIKMTSGSSDPTAYQKAIQHIRYGRSNPHASPAFGAIPANFQAPPAPGADYAWGDGQQAPAGPGAGFTDPYGAYDRPSMNGFHG